MRLSIVCGATVLLAGCAAEAPMQPPSLQPVAATASTPSCVRGALDSARAFILCPANAATSEDAAMALRSPADLSLDIASVASEYGIARQSITGIEAATYARIVGRTPEVEPRSASIGDAITINGKEFRKVSLDADEKKPVVLFLQK